MNKYIKKFFLKNFCSLIEFYDWERFLEFFRINFLKLRIYLFLGNRGGRGFRFFGE